MQNLRLMTALTAMVMTATALSACGGNECASGTTEKDGQCVPTTTLTCGDGTTLENGACVPTSTTTCGAGTILENGACVATSECGDGTMLVNGKCEPTSTITCGAGTMESNGACVPTSTLACGPGTTETNGNCVVAAPACGTGTQLDANAGTCVVTDAVCGTGTAFTNGSCLPTDAVCAMGTTFNDATATCLPDATCRMGDVVLGGICVRPVDQLISEATVMETENNDPALGGTAQALTLPAAGTKLVVAGAIGAPTDLDADTIADQDSDAYTITLAAGELIQLSVQPAAGPSLGFVVFGPDGSNYTRSSTLGLTPGAARQIFAPVAGDYTVVVEPAVTLAGNAGPIGNATWTYALTAEMLAAPTAVDVDASAAAITGEFANLNDNLFRATNLTAGGLTQFVVNSLGANVEGVYYVGDSLATMTRVFPAVVNGKQTLTLNAGEDLVFFDWVEVNGPDTSFSVNAAAPANLQALGTVSATPVVSTATTIASGDNYYYTFNATAGQVLRVRQNNSESNPLTVRLSPSSAGAFVVSSTTSFPATLSSSSLVSTSPSYTTVYIPTDGTYILEVAPSTSSVRTGTTVQLDTRPVTNLGDKLPGDTITGTVTFTNSLSEYLLVNFPMGAVLGGAFTRQGASGDPDVFIYDITAKSRKFSGNASSGATEAITGTYGVGAHLIEVKPYSNITAADYNLTITQPPLAEMEPNNDVATATVTQDGRSTTGSMIAGDTDVFSFAVATALPADQALRIKTSASSGTFTCELKDAAGTTVATATTTTGTCTIEGDALAVGTYTLHLSTAATSAINYTITTSQVTVAEFKNRTSAAIVDNVPAGTDSSITVAKPNCTVTGVQVFVNISHGYIGDLEVKLTGPTGAVVMLHDNTGGSTDDIIGIYPTNLTPTQSLDAFNALDPNGVWTLNAADNSNIIAGTLNSWGLTFTCAP